MTFLSKDVKDRLAASANIVNEIGNNFFSDNDVPQGAPHPARRYPCIVINDLSETPEYYLAGEAGLHTSQIQIDVWTDGTGGKAKANELGELVRNRMSGFRGQFGSGVYGTCRMIRNNSLAAQPTDGSDQHFRRVSQDYEIIHSADAPTFT